MKKTVASYKMLTAERSDVKERRHGFEHSEHGCHVLTVATVSDTGLQSLQVKSCQIKCGQYVLLKHKTYGVGRQKGAESVLDRAAH
jgi:hypothetical protein